MTYHGYVPTGIPDSELGLSPPPPPASNGRNQSPPSDDQELGSISVAIAKKDSAKSGCYVEGNYKVWHNYGPKAARMNNFYVAFLITCSKFGP